MPQHFAIDHIYGFRLIQPKSIVIQWSDFDICIPPPQPSEQTSNSLH